MDLGALIAGKHVLVTGASGGLGEHFARLLARCGAVVSISERRKDRLSTLCRGTVSRGSIFRPRGRPWMSRTKSRCRAFCLTSKAGKRPR
jgi:NAD(P)-dependent dehydrogenase (short-subunit alcohol dehydrogenase family)